jgi:hypothetical protein
MHGICKSPILFILVTQVHNHHKFVTFQGYLGQRTIAYTHRFLGLEIIEVITNLHNWKFKNPKPTKFFDSNFFQKNQNQWFSNFEIFWEIGTCGSLKNQIKTPTLAHTLLQNQIWWWWRGVMVWWEIRGWNPNGYVQYHHMSKLEGDKILAIDGDQWWVLWVFIFVLSCSFASYELVVIFMSGGIQYGVALLMGELCVVWNS